jgi:hypothetical protein
MGRRGPEPLYHEVGIHLFVFVAALVFVHSPADVPACLAEPLRKSDLAVGNVRLTRMAPSSPTRSRSLLVVKMLNFLINKPGVGAWRERFPAIHYIPPVHYSVLGRELGVDSHAPSLGPIIPRRDSPPRTTILTQGVRCESVAHAKTKMRIEVDIGFRQVRRPSARV